MCCVRRRTDRLSKAFIIKHVYRAIAGVIPLQLLVISPNVSLPGSPTPGLMCLVVALPHPSPVTRSIIPDVTGWRNQRIGRLEHHLSRFRDSTMSHAGHVTMKRDTNCDKVTTAITFRRWFSKIIACYGKCRRWKWIEHVFYKKNKTLK